MTIMNLARAANTVEQSPTDGAFVQDPYAFYRHCHRHHPVFWWQDYGHWCFAAYADVHALLRDKRFGRDVLHVASRDELGWPEPAEHLRHFYAFESRSLLEREPPEHTRLRRLVNKAFVSRQIERLRPRIAALAHELIDRFPRARETDLLRDFCTPIPVIVIAEMLGVPTDMCDQLLDWSHKMVAMYQHNRDRAIEDAAEAATCEFGAFMNDYVDKRRKAPGDDLLSVLIAAEEDGETLTREELVTTCILLLNAGHEATVHALGNAIKCLLENTAGAGIAAAELFRDTPSIEAVCEETLRFDAPLHMFTRYALQDCNFGGVELAKGDTVGLLLGAANRDPKRFRQPDRFIPGRRDAALLTFGGGIHFCIGAPLARLEMQTALTVLFQRLPRLRLANTPQYADRYHFHGLEDLIVNW